MIVLDASVVIAHLDSADALHRRASALLDGHATESFHMAVITRAEILVRPARLGRLEQAQRALALLDIRTVGLDADAATALADLRVETGLRLPDCCVLLEAERSGAGLATFDLRLQAAAAARAVRVVS